jgi:hypothetical protein
MSAYLVQRCTISTSRQSWLTAEEMYPSCGKALPFPRNTCSSNNASNLCSCGTGVRLEDHLLSDLLNISSAAQGRQARKPSISRPSSASSPYQAQRSNSSGFVILILDAVARALTPSQSCSRRLPSNNQDQIPTFYSVLLRLPKLLERTATGTERS